MSKALPQSSNQSGFFGRLGIYFKEMFPVTAFLAGGILTLCFLLMLHRIEDHRFIYQIPFVVTTIGMMLFILLIRIMDEFKDYPDDLVNYPDRPLPSGRVYLSDLKILYYSVIGLLFAIHLYYPALIPPAAIVFVYSLLMLKWFFVETMMRKSLPLALISHHPIVYIYFLYIFWSYTIVYPDTNFLLFLFAVPLAFLSTSWEISRKIRRPQDEDTYTTYSQVWGRKRATLIATTCNLISIFGVTYYFRSVGSPTWYFALYFLIGSLFLIPYFRFLKSNWVRKGADLKRPLREYNEGLTLWTYALIIAEYFLPLGQA
jgi:4-hydroxybenzoate polyprenyltransferase